jgi:prolyl-tRNA editing enzyme YbaK/EbsC (Cys-tRNA(Pro) deacylase)
MATMTISAMHWLAKMKQYSLESGNLRITFCCMVNLDKLGYERERKMGSLSSSAQKIQEILNEFGHNFKVIEFSKSTRTAQEAADRVGCQLGQIVKSMIFKGQVSNKGVLVLTSGANRVDEKLVGQYAHEPIGRANPDFVHGITGYAIGGVPPVGHTKPLETYIDEDLLAFPSVWAAAGTPNAVFELSPSDLVKITGGKILRVKPE